MYKIEGYRIEGVWSDDFETVPNSFSTKEEAEIMQQELVRIYELDVNYWRIIEKKE